MDIAERLRAWERGACMRPTIYDEAADEIDRLRAEVKQYKADALRYRGLRRRLGPAGREVSMVTVDMINALARAAQRLLDEADRIAAADPRDYRAEYPSEDARLIRDAIGVLLRSEGHSPRCAWREPTRCDCGAREKTEALRGGEG